MNPQQSVAGDAVEVVGELVVDDGETLEQRHGPRALAVAREIETALVPYVAQNPTYAPLWEQFRAAPAEQAPALTGVLQVILAADAALARRLDALLARYRKATGASIRIDTGGGAYVGGEVRVSGGDFVGRDQTKVLGDAAIAHDQASAAVVKQSADPEAIARAFETFYRALEAQPDLSGQEKADLRAELEEAEEEMVKGQAADEGFIARRLRHVKRMAPDIWDVILATFGSPAAGLGLVAKKIAQKMKADAEAEEATP